MTKHKKPVLAATNTRVCKNGQSNNTPTHDLFQCPCCKLTGNTDLFELGWPDRLHELIARHSGSGIDGDITCMDYLEAHGLYNWLSRHGG